MSGDLTLVVTDVVDSTQVNARCGDAAMANAWARHDAMARELMRRHHGREAGRSDGFVVVFEAVHEALAFAAAYHAGLATIEPPLQARVGVHIGPVRIRDNSASDREQGAVPFEIDGIALPVAARVMSIAGGRQTLLSAAAFRAIETTGLSTVSHGYWQLKGVPEPIELFEIGEDNAPFTPPADSAKAYRVIHRGNQWIPVRDIPNSLPVERDSFIGRDDVLVAMGRPFDEGVRLVSLLGVGGVGKTRLALRYARRWLGAYAGGAWFCDLSTASTRDGILQAVARALDVRLGKADPAEQLGASIASRGSCLVVLDNFEQVVEHAEETIGVWLDQAPDARFIVTSREVLGIVGEHALVVAPLSNTEATQLFYERVRAAGLNIGPSIEDAAAVAPLVALLDRLPLAIELAAARARLMPPRALLQRMNERFRLLVSRRGRRDRQATLRATLRWSWELLSAAEQSAMAQLSAFEGGFTLDAVDAVVDVHEWDEALWAGDLLQALVEKSLVRADENGRFDLLRSVHDYADEQLAAMPSELRARAWRRHAAYFSALTEQQATADRCAEADNLINACRRMASAEPSLAAGALINSWAVLQLTGPFRTGLELAQSLQTIAIHHTGLRMAVDRVMGGALSLLGQMDAARDHYRACIELAESLGAHALQAQMLARVAEIDITSGKLEPAGTALESALLLSRQAGDSAAIYTALNALGKLHLVQNRWLEARSYYEAALEIAEAIGHTRWEGGLHGNLAITERLLGRSREALDHVNRSATIARDVGDRQWEGNARCNLGLMLHEMGDDAAARTELDAALHLARQTGHRRLEATTLCNLGIVSEGQRDLQAAFAFYSAAITAAREIGDVLLEGPFCGYLGLLCARMGQSCEAHASLARGEALLTGVADAGTLGLLLCQRTSAAAVLNERSTALASLVSAERLIEPLAPPPQSELGMALISARRQVAGLID